MHGDRVGHIKKQQAARIASLMDNSNLALKIEGTIPHPGNDYSLPVKLDFYSVSPSNAEMTDTTARSKRIAFVLKGVMAGEYAFKLSSAFNTLISGGNEGVKLDIKPSTVENKALDWKKRTKELDKMFDKQTGAQLESTPTLDIPLQFRPSVKLFDYQQYGIRWLAHQETASRAVPFYKREYENKKWVWNCEITRCSQLQAPRSIKGSILADEKGLGKTLQAIGLILAAPPKGYSYPDGKTSSPKEVKGKVALENNYPLEEDIISAPTSLMNLCTLIICPASIMSNWQHQIKTHLIEGVLRVNLYQDSHRTKIISDLKEGNVDVLLVSYNILIAEFSHFHDTSAADEEPYQKRKKIETIFDINFHRVILDEAHTIRSSKTEMFKAVMGVKTDRKLVLTEKPYERIDDLHTLLSFIGVEPLVDVDIFRRAITQPLKEGDAVGMFRLRTALFHTALRRSKELVNVTLVEKEVKLCTVTFPDGTHKQVYDALLGTFWIAYQALFQDGEDEEIDVSNNYTSVFEKLLHLRQSCCSAELLPLKYRDIAPKNWGVQNPKKKFTAQDCLALLEKVKCNFNQDSQRFECSICHTELEEQDKRTLSTCLHIFCGKCISRVVESYSGNCPFCQMPCEQNDTIGKCIAANGTSQNEARLPVPASKDKFGTSPKILALLEVIKGMKPNEKGVIFSLFTPFLDLIGVALIAAGHHCVQINGFKSTGEEIDSVTIFNSTLGDNPRFILCSLPTAGQIKLTRGNVVFIMDVGWNRAVENQAIDRIYCSGQERKVTVVRFVMKNSIEECMVSLQEVTSMRAEGRTEKPRMDGQREARLSDLENILFDSD